MAALISIIGALYSGLQLVSAPPAVGEVVAIVQEVRSEKPVSDATIDILTPEEALVTSFQPTENGRGRRKLKEGTYRLRVSHPRYGAESRHIYVMAGQTAEIRIQLTPRRSAPMSQATGTVSEGVGALQRFFRDLGL